MSALEIECPKCGALPNARCRTLKTNRTTDTHIARWSVIWAMRRAANAARSGGER